MDAESRSGVQYSVLRRVLSNSTEYTDELRTQWLSTCTVQVLVQYGGTSNFQYKYCICNLKIESYPYVPVRTEYVPVLVSLPVLVLYKYCTYSVYYTSTRTPYSVQYVPVNLHTRFTGKAFQFNIR